MRDCVATRAAVIKGQTGNQDGKRVASQAKFDGKRAWTEAARMLSANRKVVTVIAGVFFFLPYLAIMLFAPDMISPTGGEEPAQDPEQAMAQLAAYGPRFMATMLALGIVQAVGVLGLLRLLADPARPMVGQALGSGVSLLVPYLLAQLMQALIFLGVVGIPVSLLSALGSPVVDFIAGVAMFMGLIYLFVRYSLISPVIALDGVRSPVAALRRSWHLTAGKVGQIASFYILLFFAIFVVIMVVSVMLGLLFALMGGQIEGIGNALVGSIANAVLASVMMAVLAAVHGQLTGDRADQA